MLLLTFELVLPPETVGHGELHDVGTLAVGLHRGAKPAVIGENPVIHTRNGAGTQHKGIFL